MMHDIKIAVFTLLSAFAVFGLFRLIKLKRQVEKHEKQISDLNVKISSLEESRDEWKDVS